MSGRHHFHIVKYAGGYVERDDDQSGIGMLLLEGFQTSQVLRLHLVAWLGVKYVFVFRILQENRE